MLLSKYQNSLKLKRWGLGAVRACKRCRGCRDCSYRGMMISREEEEAVKRVEESIKYDEEKQCVSLTYPWTEDVCKLTDNVRQVIGFQRSYEKTLIQRNELEFYN